MSESNERVVSDGPANGMRRADQNGLEIIDAMAGRSSVLGYGNEAVAQAIQAVSADYLGDANRFDPCPDTNDEFLAAIRELIGGSQHVLAESIVLCPSADASVETAIGFARRWKNDAHRTVALNGSDHGRTLACRTASGRPELHDGYGPMVAGFAHIPPNDIDALRATIDENTACLLLTPIDLHDGAQRLDADYIMAAREACDENRAALIIDESRLCFGASGRPFSYTSIAGVRADGVILAAGIFNGLPGGIFIGSDRLTDSAGTVSQALPLQRAVAMATFAEMCKAELPDAVAEELQDFAVRLAERIGGFEFIRDVHASGMTIGIVTDISANEIVGASAKQGLYIEAAGETAIRIQLPLIADQNDRIEMIERFGLSLEQIERETADAVQS